MQITENAGFSGESEIEGAIDNMDVLQNEIPEEISVVWKIILKNQPNMIIEFFLGIKSISYVMMLLYLLAITHLFIIMCIENFLSLFLISIGYPSSFVPVWFRMCTLICIYNTLPKCVSLCFILLIIISKLVSYQTWSMLRGLLHVYDYNL